MGRQNSGVARESDRRPNSRSVDDLRRELARTRPLCRAWIETVLASRRDAMAAKFARHALEAFAARIDADIVLSAAPIAPARRLDRAAERLAVTIGAEAADLPLAEGLHFVTGLYPLLLTANNRSALGAFYTPPCLTARLLDQAEEQGVDWTQARVLDPAAGAGAFLIGAALRMREALKGAEPAFVLRQMGVRLLGLEIDPQAAALAQAAMEIVLADLARAAKLPVPNFVRVCDTLAEKPNGSFDLVIGNPPYGRVALTPAQRTEFRRGLFGHANLYGVFTDIAVRWAKAGGLVAYLTPTSFLAGQYYSALRRLLAQEAPPIAVDFVHARKGVFEDVLQETLLAVYRKGETASRAQVHYLHVASECDAHVTRNGTIGLPADPADPWLAPRSPEHAELIRHVEGMSARLADWGYSVSTGPLVWNRFKAQLRDRASKDTRPLVWAESVTADGRFLFRALKKNHAPFFKMERRDDWLLVDRPCVLVQRTTAKEQARRLIAAELPADFVTDHGGVVVENHLNMVRAHSDAAVPPAVVAALLNSDVLDQVFRCMNGSVAVSAFELEALPLPDASALAPLAAMLADGTAADTVQAECDRLYGRGTA